MLEEVSMAVALKIVNNVSGSQMASLSGIEKDIP